MPRTRSALAVSLAAAIGLLTGPAPAFARAEDRPGANILAPASAEVLAADSRAFTANNTALAHPFFEGRAPGTRGNQLAADMLEFHFKNLGLAPAFADDQTGVPNASYRQTFEFGKTARVLGQSAEWTAGGAPVTLEAGKQFNVLAFSGSGEATGPLVFAGYGINMGEDGYTSFPDGTDLTGKIVLLFRFEPMDEDGRSRWGQDNWTYHSQLESKISAVARRNPAGIILAHPPGLDDDWVNEQRDRLKQDPLPALETFESVSAMTGPAKVPVVMVTIEVAEALVKAASPQRFLLDLRKAADAKGEVVELDGVTVTLRADVERSPILTSNIGGIVKGSGALADEYIVIGAHYDHVGYGKFGAQPENRGKIHPGADDNASGTAGLMVLAEKLANACRAMPADTPRRSFLLIAFTAEESGLNGSRHYTRHMIADKSRHYLMMNMDMIGRLRESPPLEVSGVGTGEGLEEFVKPYLDSSGLVTKSLPGGQGPSDHASFDNAGIPVLFFFTGLHEQYHKPTDTPDLINPEGAARIIDLAYRIGLGAAERPDAMPHTRPGRDGGDPHEPASPGPVPVKVRFGVTPGSYGEEKGGVLFDAVAEGWSAAKAGLKAGDRLIRWNGQDVPNVESWMPLLGTAKPGDVVKVTVIRDGKEMDFDVTMMGRDTRGK